MKISGMGLLIGALVVASVSLVHSADDEAVKQAAVAKPITVRGRALDSDGEPIKGAVVFLVSTGLIEKTLGQTVTDGEGRYDFCDIPLPIGEPAKESSFQAGTFQVFGKAEGHAFAWCGNKTVWVNPKAELLDADGKPSARFQESTYLADDRIELELVFERAWPVKGTITDERGEGIASGKVRIANCDYLDLRGKETHPNYREFWALMQAAKLMADQVVATSDEQGNFELSHVPAGLVCWLHVTHPDHAKLALYTATADKPPAERRGHPVQKLPLSIKLASTRSIPITVQHPETRAATAGVYVVARQSDARGSSAYGTSNKEGTLVLRLPPGLYTVDAMPADSSAFVRTFEDLRVAESPAEQPMKLALRLGCHLVLQAVDADTDAPVAGATYMRVSEGGRTMYFPARSDSGRGDLVQSTDQGETRLLVDPLQPRRYAIQPPKGYQAADPEDTRGRQLELVAGKTVDATFRLRKADK